jgi:hypothetical protein
MMDPNVSIHEAKTITCNVRSGRRAADATRERLADEAVPSDQRRPHGASQAHGADAGEAT